MSLNGFAPLVWAMGREAVPPLPRFLLVALASYADEEWSCWPSYERLASDTGMSRATVARHLGWLRKHGYLAWKHRADDGGQRKTNRYFLDPDGGHSPHLADRPESQTETDPESQRETGPESQRRKPESQSGGGQSLTCETGSTREVPDEVPAPRAREREPMPSATTEGLGLLNEHIAAHPQRPPRKVLAACSREIENLLAEGYSPEIVRKALAELRGRPRNGPGFLPYIVAEIQQQTPQRPEWWPSGWGAM